MPDWVIFNYFPGHSPCFPRGINSNNEIAGGTGEALAPIFFRAADGTLSVVDLMLDPSFVYDTSNLNDSRLIGGGVSSLGDPYAAWLRKPDGTIVTFNPPIASPTGPTGPFDNIVVEFGDHQARWTPQQISNLGTAVGTATLAVGEDLSPKLTYIWKRTSDGTITTVKLQDMEDNGSFPTINANDQIAGTFGDINTSVWKGFTWDGISDTVDFFSHPLAGSGPSQGTLATGIDDDETIVGSYIDADGIAHGFLLKDAVYTNFDLNPTVAGGFDLPPTQMYCAIKNGLLAGTWQDSSPGNWHAFYRTSDGTLTGLNYPGAVNTLAVAANNHNFVTGFFENPADGDVYWGFIVDPLAPTGSTGTTGSTGGSGGFLCRNPIPGFAVIPQVSSGPTELSVEVNDSFPNRIQLTLGLLPGPWDQEGPLGAFDPRRDLEVYVDGKLIPVQSYQFDPSSDSYLMSMSKQINLHGVIQVVHHMPSPPFLDSTVCATGASGSTGSTGGGLTGPSLIVGPYLDPSDSSIQYGFKVLETNGVLSFGTFVVPGGSTGSGGGTQPYTVNTSGTIAGTYLNPMSGNFEGFLRSSGGVFTTFTIAGSVWTVPVTINNAGQIGGYYQDSGGVYHGFLREADGTITTFDAPGAGTDPGTGTSIHGWQCINSSGEMVVFSVGASMFSIRHTDGTFTSFSVTSTIQAIAVINDAGIVAGSYTTDPFSGAGVYFIRDTDGTITTFNPPGSIAFIPFTASLNNQGQLTGFYHEGSTSAVAFIRDSNGSLTTFIPGDTTNFGGGFAFIDDNSNVCGQFSNGTDAIIHGFFRDALGNVTTFDIPSCSDVNIPGTAGMAAPIAMAIQPE